MKDSRKIYLIGICGTAMASLAGMLREKGYAVSGSDSDVYPPMSDFLARLEIPVFKGFNAENIQKAQPDLVVIGNALSRGNVEIEYVLDAGIRYASMADTVKEIFIRGKNSIVVAGTHGKTTTTAMLAWILQAAGRNPSFLVGGIGVGEWQAANIRTAGEGMAFDVSRNGSMNGNFTIPLPGTFNVQNALGAILVARELAVDDPVIQAGLSTFKSVKRRLELRGEI